MKDFGRRLNAADTEELAIGHRLNQHRLTLISHPISKEIDKSTPSKMKKEAKRERKVRR